jgi:glycine/D-amino acid oxidase-like deaminating enzyme
VGAGYTGLWTAYYLKRAQPALDIVIAEAEFAGFGASGRNGGWLTGNAGWSVEPLLKAGGHDGVRAMMRALLASPDEVIAVAQAEGIEADILRCDELIVATNPAQMQRLRRALLDRQSWQIADDRARILGPSEARTRVGIPALHGALAIGGQARLQPAKLVTGLARAVERLGVTIFETTPVTAVRAGAVQTRQGVIQAAIVLRATEGFSCRLPGQRRRILPLNSAQIVTAPLPPDFWQATGWAGREILGDAAHGYCYAQRTRDDRIAFGGRGLPYRFGSRFDDSGRTDQATLRMLRDRLHQLFPQTRAIGIDHAWSGVLGVARDWAPGLGFDAGTGLGWAGGYLGTGVATSNLAGRTLADLVLGRASDLARLPWVNRTPRKGEPEPLRWLGVRGAYALYAAADRREYRLGGKTSALGRIGDWLTGDG